MMYLDQFVDRLEERMTSAGNPTPKDGVYFIVKINGGLTMGSNLSVIGLCSQTPSEHLYRSVRYRDGLDPDRNFPWLFSRSLWIIDEKYYPWRRRIVPSNQTLTLTVRKL